MKMFVEAVWRIEQKSDDEKISDEDRAMIRKKFDKSRRLFSDIRIRDLGFNFSNVAYVKCEGNITFENLQKMAYIDDTVSVVVEIPDDLDISISDIGIICDMASERDAIVIKTDSVKLRYDTRTGRVVKVEGDVGDVKTWLLPYINRYREKKDEEERMKRRENKVNNECDEYEKKLEDKRYSLFMEIDDIRKALDKIERHVRTIRDIDDMPDCVLDEVEEILDC